ncbi:MAG: hypothetical protein ABH879_05290 [archaeon]
MPFGTLFTLFTPFGDLPPVTHDEVLASWKAQTPVAESIAGRGGPQYLDIPPGPGLEAFLDSTLEYRVVPESGLPYTPSPNLVMNLTNGQYFYSGADPEDSLEIMGDMMRGRSPVYILTHFIGTTMTGRPLTNLQAHIGDIEITWPLMGGLSRVNINTPAKYEVYLADGDTVAYAVPYWNRKPVDLPIEGFPEFEPDEFRTLTRRFIDWRGEATEPQQFIPLEKKQMEPTDPKNQI